MPEKKILNPSSSGMDIPDAAIERVARVMLPMIQKYYESDEGKMELEKWKQEKENKRMDKRVLSAEEKALLQAKHRMEEAQAREREKERKRRTRRLIQEGAILESVFPAAVDMDFVALKDYLAERLRG